MTALSLCTGMRLFDRAFLDAGFAVTPGCEIDPEQRLLYAQVCGGGPLAHDLSGLPALVAGRPFDGVLGGPPCQSLTRLRAIRRPKYADLTPGVAAVLAAVRPSWFLFENVSPLAIPGARHARLDAMHYAAPHQSRPRWFTFSPGLVPPAKRYRGTVDDLLAYPVVAGRIYGPRRAAVLQGWPAAARLKAPCRVIQKGLANAVHYAVARAWADSIRSGRREPSLFDEMT